MSFNRRLAHDQDGGVLLETTVLIPIIFVFVMGAVDFLFGFYEWNAASKAVEVGARIAAVSDPVAVGFNSISMGVLNPPTVSMGDPMPDFQVTCVGHTPPSGTGTGTCTCTRGACPGMGSYSSQAMSTIVFGRNSTSCFDATWNYWAGMCDIVPRITDPNVNVSIVYTQTGLGYAGRNSGPVPTITVSLQNLPFTFFFLSGFLHFTPINIPALTTTITGEALSSGAQP